MTRAAALAIAFAALVADARADDAGAHADALAAIASPDPAARRGAIDALARDGTPEDARALVAASAGAPYATRAAITQALEGMGDRAVAALVVAKRGKPYATASWAAGTLEAMGKERADEQIRTRSDDVLVGILHAYGEARDPDALGVLASFVGSDRAPVREAARAAIVAYGDDALTKLRQDYADLAGTPAPPAWDAARVARELFAASDRLRLREVYALLDEGRARVRAGDVAGAVDDFDRVLARQPQLEERTEMVPTYVAYAIDLEDRDPLGARLALEKAQRLDPSSPRAGAIAGELAYLEARDLAAHGAPDEAAFRRALALDPGNSRARAALDRLETAAEARARRLRAWKAIAGGLVALVAFAILFVGRRARRARHAGT